MRLNDPKGRTYFYKKDNKMYFVNHIDSKNVIDRKATDKDKQDYPEQWEQWKNKL